ncbi:MAG TPA: flippase activity-associated protein Agl23 [Ktedonobacteraceae bacterium]|nr:flippase activity-associated protein Agl23 [Ktedonobacteraceae bacterium]
MKSYETEQGNKVNSAAHAEVGAQDIRDGRETGEVEETGEEVGVIDLPDNEAGEGKPSPLLVHGGRDEDEDEEPLASEARRPRFRRPTRAQVMEWLPFIAIVLLGAILRYWDLGAKPLHHDESLHAYFSMQLLHDLENWIGCYAPGASCYTYNPLLHGPFQFHLIAFVYRVSQLLGAPDNGINTTTVRIGAATLGSAIVALPYFLRDFLGKVGAWLACFLLAISPSLVYYSRFAREDIYMAFFTLLLVVATARYIRTRKMRWIIIGAAAFSLSYATAEATFLTIAVFGSFLVGLLIWEIGLRVPLKSASADETQEGKRSRYQPRTAAPFLLLGYILVAGVAAKILFGWLNALSVYITDPQHTTASNLFVQNLKNITVDIIPWLGILLGIYVLSILWREMNGKMPEGRRGLAAKLDPRIQRTLDTILTMPWTHWFFAVLVAWAIFLDLFTVEFTNIRGGIGDGIWAGIYYWLQQQEVARGGQPWYYYLMLIPLYEQIGLVFGIVGAIRTIMRPTRFRIFILYWTVGNLVIYSWAAEKMPWLVIFITMPLMLLAAIGMEPIVVTAINFVKQRFASATAQSAEQPVERNNGIAPVLPTRSRPRKRVGALAGTGAILGVLVAVVLLIPTLHNMYEVTYVEPADAPHEMLIYVQTTTDINIVMAKVNALDQKLYGGKHLLSIGLTNDATWPYAWYLRDYPNVCFNYPDGCPSIAKDIPVIITGGDDIGGYIADYSKGYAYQQYRMRTWWDEGYKPPPCVPTTANNNCAGQQEYGGVGLWLWLSYGDNPPPNAKFNLGLAIQHVWEWETQRRAIGSTDGSYDMLLFIRKDLLNTGVTP